MAPQVAGVPITRVGQVTLDAAGGGTAQVFCPGMDWVVNSRSVTITGSTAAGAVAGH